MKQLTIVGTVLLALGVVSARAADDPSDKPAGEVPQPTGKVLQFQEFDNPVQRLQPVKSRDAGEEARLEAMAWFGSGRVLQDRGDLNGALRAYRKAIARDPNAIAVYRVANERCVEARPQSTRPTPTKIALSRTGIAPKATALGPSAASAARPSEPHV